MILMMQSVRSSNKRRDAGRWQMLLARCLIRTNGGNSSKLPVNAAPAAAKCHATCAEWGCLRHSRGVRSGWAVPR